MNERLAEALRRAVIQKRRPVAVSAMFIRVLCRAEGLTSEVVEWLGRRGVAVAQTGSDEFSFRPDDVVVGGSQGSLFGDKYVA